MSQICDFNAILGQNTETRLHGYRYNKHTQIQSDDRTTHRPDSSTYVARALPLQCCRAKFSSLKYAQAHFQYSHIKNGCATVTQMISKQMLALCRSFFWGLVFC